MAKYEAIRGFCLDGKDIAQGEVIELDPRKAQEYVTVGHLVPHVAPPPDESADEAGGPGPTEPGTIEQRDPEPVNREPRTRRGKGKK